MFFFFKQKPAYDMRSSDWSSDVFSSDLSRVPVRAFTASSRCRMAVKRRVIRRTATRSRRSFSCAALKEASARFAPALLCAGIFRRDRPQQRAGEHVGVDLVGTRGDDEFAKLANAAFLEGLRFRFERLQFRIDVAGFAHVASQIGRAPV